MVQNFTLEIPPSVNRIWRTDFKSGRVFKTKDAYQYARDVRLLVPRNIIEGHVALVLRFYFKTTARDIDSGLKTLLDALQGRIYADDKQVAVLTVYKLKDSKNPRVEVEARPINLE